MYNFKIERNNKRVNFNQHKSFCYNANKYSWAIEVRRNICMQSHGGNSMQHKNNNENRHAKARK